MISALTIQGLSAPSQEVIHNGALCLYVDQCLICLDLYWDM